MKQRPNMGNPSLDLQVLDRKIRQKTIPSAKFVRGEKFRASDPEVGRRNRREFQNAEGQGMQCKRPENKIDYRARKLRKLTARALSAMWAGMPCCMMKNGRWANAEVSGSIGGYGGADEDLCAQIAQEMNYEDTLLFMVFPLGLHNPVYFC